MSEQHCIKEKNLNHKEINQRCSILRHIIKQSLKMMSKKGGILPYEEGKEANPKGEKN